MAGAAMDPQRAAAEGRFTQAVYGCIRDHRWHDAIEILEQQLQERPDSRPALSLLGHCYFHTSEFEAAAKMYERLAVLHPDNDDYRLHLAHSLHKAGHYVEAAQTAARVGRDRKGAAATLLFAIAYERSDLAECRRLLDGAPRDDPDAVANAGCLLYASGDYAAAAKKFDDATHALGRLPQLLYGAAACHFKQRAYGPALQLVAEVVDRGAREHPELAIGSYSERIASGGAAAAANDEPPAARSVGNSQALAATALVEALNLRAAVEAAVGNPEGVKAALGDMPPRSEEELDPVTLHNSALAGMESDPGAGFRKLNHLLTLDSFPPEAFPNLLLLYASPRHQLLDQAADLVADNPGLAGKLLTRDLSDLLAALVLRASSPDEALSRLDELAGRHVAALHSLTKRLQDARLARDNEAIRVAVQQYDDALERYIPVLMAMASILWEREQWGAVERLLRQSADFCIENDAWRLNMAHALYMQERYADAISHYQPLVVRRAEALLSLPAVVLANLCVCYVMTSQNEEAEELMRRVEAAEEEAAGLNSGGQPGGNGPLHLAIINLVIGTLYCAKANYEFGVSRVAKALEPLPARLSPDTWFYAKTALLAALEGLAKHTVVLGDAAWRELAGFLSAAEAAGRAVPAAFAGAGADRSVAAEAREMRWLLRRLEERR